MKSSLAVEWYTPPEMIRALGDFDLDPASPVMRPWDTAASHYNMFDNGLAKPWHGRVWMNPPFGRGEGVERWAARMADHGNGVALYPARTGSRWFQESVLLAADAVLFVTGKVFFWRPVGEGKAVPSKNPLPIGVVLAAYGKRNVVALLESGIEGVFVVGAGVRA